ncbi:hypothetical protein HYH03_000640 [Edaphochlamys debaryana]|uniref:PDZ domain-containing protein n=1 Tax=Edaphochlamys debaryana TaxID=47281 RepID=A0A836C7D8_9CHLO|nr:hypothetical protein HYH03_000640 [Edaphochlamys debaryana]|eukprot:KAG2502153.1 hypothetical protein HYH03_000640 [Edaphochlamys debaryana]
MRSGHPTRRQPGLRPSQSARVPGFRRCRHAVWPLTGGQGRGPRPALSSQGGDPGPSNSPQQPGDGPLGGAIREWLQRAGACAAGAAVTLSLLAGSASADLASVRPEPALHGRTPTTAAASSSGREAPDSTPGSGLATAATTSRGAAVPQLWGSNSGSAVLEQPQQGLGVLPAFPGARTAAAASSTTGQAATTSLEGLSFSLVGAPAEASSAPRAFPVAGGRGLLLLTTGSPAAPVPYTWQPHAVHPAYGSAGDVEVIQVQPSSELASETEDRLLEAARQVEARLENAVDALLGGVPRLLSGASSEGQDAESATEAAHALIREVWEVVDSNYLDARSTGFERERWAELRDAALAVPYRDTSAGYRAIRDLLARGLSDPYCRFIGPGELQAMKKYDVSGVGLNLGTANEYVVKTGNDLPNNPRDPSAGEGVYVVGVSKGSPADRAGVRQGDELVAIQGRSLGTEMTPFRAAGIISGVVDEAEGEAQGGKQQAGRRKGGSGGAEEVVRVRVRHADGEQEEVAFSRPRRTLPAAVATSLSRSPAPANARVTVAGAGAGAAAGEEVVGTLKLSAFNARAQSDLVTAIRELEGAGASRLVLDLRDNRGGLVTEGLEVARLFLDGDAPIVITERRDSAPDTPLASGPALTSAPLLVLVNDHTASASEIVAGALRDNCRAVLVGSRTYGKGLIQSVYELRDGSGLVITVGKYLTPRGNDIDRYGIKPDYASIPSAAQYDDTIRACRLSGPPAVAPPTPVEKAAELSGAAVAVAAWAGLRELGR